MKKDRFTFEDPGFVVTAETERLLKLAKHNPFHDDEVCFTAHPAPPPHIEVASSTEAMKLALQEYIVRLMFEDATGWTTPYNALLYDAEIAAREEFRAARINKGIK